MLYIFQSLIVLMWLIYLIKREKYPLHAIITAYFIYVMVADIPEIVINQILEFYKFPAHLLIDSIKDNQLGIVFSDGIILPITSIIACHYASHTKKLWRTSFIVAAIQGILEWIYLSLGYLVYFRWNIWISIAMYFFISRFFISFASRLLNYNPPIPYFYRMTVSTYTITAWFGAVLGGALLNLYQWTPHIIGNPSGDDRFSDLCISWILALFSAIIIPKTKPKNKPIIFIAFAVLTIVFSYYAYSQGWLVYHKWNNLFTALRWLVPFILLIFYERWENKYRNSY